MTLYGDWKKNLFSCHVAPANSPSYLYCCDEQKPLLPKKCHWRRSSITPHTSWVYANMQKVEVCQPIGFSNILCWEANTTQTTESDGALSEICGGQWCRTEQVFGFNAGVWSARFKEIQYCIDMLDNNRFTDVTSSASMWFIFDVEV